MEWPFFRDADNLAHAEHLITRLRADMARLEASVPNCSPASSSSPSTSSRSGTIGSFFDDLGFPEVNAALDDCNDESVSVYAPGRRGE